jgi:hypothetical protein
MHTGSALGQHRRDLPVREQRRVQALSNPGAMLDNPAPETHRSARGLEKLGPLLADAYPDLVVSKRRMRKVESIECVRLNREVARQNLGFRLDHSSCAACR